MPTDKSIDIKEIALKDWSNRVLSHCYWGKHSLYYQWDQFSQLCMDMVEYMAEVTQWRALGIWHQTDLDLKAYCGMY
jgi:hypothetical protein